MKQKIKKKTVQLFKITVYHTKSNVDPNPADALIRLLCSNEILEFQSDSLDI